MADDLKVKDDLKAIQQAHVLLAIKEVREKYPQDNESSVRSIEDICSRFDICQFVDEDGDIDVNMMIISFLDMRKALISESLSAGRYKVFVEALLDKMKSIDAGKAEAIEATMENRPVKGERLH